MSAQPKTPRDLREAFTNAALGIGVRERRRPEVWALFAWLIGIAFVAMLIYLGLRPGGRGPVFVYDTGRNLLGLFAVVVLFVGAVWSALHRPFLQRRRIFPFVCVIGVIGVVSYPFPYPSSHEGHESAILFRLPVEGEWTVFWGGETKDESLLAGYFADRRWGLDLVVTQDGRSHRGEGFDPADYFAYGRDVFAPADGEVVRVNSGVSDSRPGIYDSRVEAFGNFVVLKVADREFVFLCHLAPDSLAVREGSRVRAGEVLGKVGNSGYSTVTPEPHLAMHLQDTSLPREGEAVPWKFSDYIAEGMHVTRGLPRGGIGPAGEFLGERVQIAGNAGR